MITLGEKNHKLRLDIQPTVQGDKESDSPNESLDM